MSERLPASAAVVVLRRLSTSFTHFAGLAGSSSTAWIAVIETASTSKISATSAIARGESIAFGSKPYLRQILPIASLPSAITKVAVLLQIREKWPLLAI
ncbi:hypothetical protein VTI28DRAFT_5046 [Corynascus sepedonium]